MTSDPSPSSVSLATVAEWRRRRDVSAEPGSAPDEETPRNGFQIAAHAAGPYWPEEASNGFAGLRRARLATVTSVTKTAAPTHAPIIYQPPCALAKNPSRQAVPATGTGEAAGLEMLLSLAQPAVLAPAAAKVPVRAPRPARPRRQLTIPLPLVIVLTVQAVLSARFLHANTAFGDEALYLWAGHLEWSHWLHGTNIPPFPTWFSGSPVIYPPLAALADNVGGLAAARLLSLAFMLGTTVLLWATTLRLSSRQHAFYTALLFAVIGPTLHLGAFATYDSMALFFLAAAAWCACGARTREDATGWIVAAAGFLALANATKYASAIFDPIVIVMAVLCACPRPGGKAALRRGTLLLTGIAGALAILLRLGGSWYITGISQTTTMRPNGGTPLSRVLAFSWQWSAVVVVAALAGVVLSVLQGDSRPRTWLIATLAAAALLVPVEQMRIQTTVSLNKHVDFGAWFASIAAGYAVSCLATWLRPRRAKLMATVLLSAAMIPVAIAGASQAQAMDNWPGTAHLVAFLKPITSHGGRFLAETDDVPEYYLPQTSWRQWSNTFSITRPDGRQENADGRLAPYALAIRDHYFSLIVLSFSETAVIDQAITRVLRATPGYRVIGIVPYGGPVPGDYTVWAYRPRAQHGAP